MRDFFTPEDFLKRCKTHNDEDLYDVLTCEEVYKCQKPFAFVRKQGMPIREVINRVISQYEVHNTLDEIAGDIYIYGHKYDFTNIRPVPGIKYRIGTDENDLPDMNTKLFLIDYIFDDRLLKNYINPLIHTKHAKVLFLVRTRLDTEYMRPVPVKQIFTTWYWYMGKVITISAHAYDPILIHTRDGRDVMMVFPPKGIYDDVVESMGNLAWISADRKCLHIWTIGAEKGFSHINTIPVTIHTELITKIIFFSMMDVVAFCDNGIVAIVKTPFLDKEDPDFSITRRAINELPDVYQYGGLSLNVDQLEDEEREREDIKFGIHVSSHVLHKDGTITRIDGGPSAYQVIHHPFPWSPHNHRDCSPTTKQLVRLVMMIWRRDQHWLFCPKKRGRTGTFSLKLMIRMMSYFLSK